jgi:hypothetical protein
MNRLTARSKNGEAYYPVCIEACDGEPQDCGNCDIDKDICDRLAAYEDTGLEPGEIPHWISVSVPPKAEGWYLVAIKCDTEYHVEQDFYATDIAKEHGHEPGFCKARHFHITHWMPLPAAPKEEK